MKLAKRYFCAKCGAEYLVTKEGDPTASCCGTAMTEETETEKPTTPSKDKRVTLEGCRYHCNHCGVQILCIVPGAGLPSCCGEDMVEEHLRMDLMSE